MTDDIIIKNRLATAKLDAETLLNVMERSSIRYSLKDENLNYVYCSRAFENVFTKKTEFINDFQLFDNPTASSIQSNDRSFFDAQLNEESKEKLRLINAELLSVVVNRTLIKIGDDTLLLSTFNEIKNLEE